jgi:sugar/nucleoside kinase (ribokinase family)
VDTSPVEVAESTGAGDAFAAGFLAAWLRGEGPLQCGMAGNAAAALVLQAPGTNI